MRQKMRWLYGLGSVWVFLLWSVWMASAGCADDDSDSLASLIVSASGTPDEVRTAGTRASTQETVEILENGLKSAGVTPQDIEQMSIRVSYNVVEDAGGERLDLEVRYSVTQKMLKSLQGRDLQIPYRRIVRRGCREALNKYFGRITQSPMMVLERVMLRAVPPRDAKDPNTDAASILSAIDPVIKRIRQEGEAELHKELGKGASCVLGASVVSRSDGDERKREVIFCLEFSECLDERAEEAGNVLEEALRQRGWKTDGWK